MYGLGLNTWAWREPSSSCTIFVSHILLLYPSTAGGCVVVDVVQSSLDYDSSICSHLCRECARHFKRSPSDLIRCDYSVCQSNSESKRPLKPWPVLPPCMDRAQSELDSEDTVTASLRRSSYCNLLCLLCPSSRLLLRAICDWLPWIF